MRGERGRMSMTEAVTVSPVEEITEVPGSFWESLRYFNIYRFAVAVPALCVALVFHDALSLGSHNPKLFTYTSACYALASVGFHLAMRKWRVWFNAQLSAHVLTDILAITLLMHASAGMRSGLGVMLLISLAGAALVSRGTLMLFYSAMASIAVLLEQTYWILIEDHATISYLQPGLMSMGYFASALITNQLAQRLIMNERVARLRGEDLANQLRINQLVIRDVQVGVMVVDANGLVRLHNRQVAELLGGAAPELDQIERYSPDIARRLDEWRSGAGPDTVNVYFEESLKMVRARFVAAGVAGNSFALVFLEDLSKQQELAQQLKLAALGRLTANIAHEIRNPLSAITHAGDLLREESPSGSSARLVNIIQDNARRLDRMVKDVLELSRRDRVQAVEISLGAYLRDFIVEFSRNESIPPGAIQLEVSGEVGIEFDRTHLNQVLWNLTRNAWRHSTKGENCIRVRATRRGARVEVHVMDDGSGVPRELQAQLFEPFFTTFSSGTGLGLYIAKELCAANGASLEYVPAGQGANFRIQWQPQWQPN
jgi:two-component system, NtrC family, sensor histidine kinase PilS